MPITVTCECGKSYDLKDEFAGKLVKCPDCGRSVRVGSSSIVPQADPAFDRDRFLLRQQHLSINEKYYVWDESNQPILFVERPRHLAHNLGAAFGGVAAGGVFCCVGMVAGMALAGAVTASESQADDFTAFIAVPVVIATIVVAVLVAVVLQRKRHVELYRDDTRNERMLEILQDKKVQFLNATYTVTDKDGKVLGKLHKNYLYNFIRKRWYCYAPDGSVICVAKEDSPILALLRRALGPMFGFLRTNFLIFRGNSDEVIGEFNRKFTLLDRYVLDMSNDPQRAIDRRLALALGVMLDTGERR